MTKPIAVAATFSDVKNIKGRKLVQLVFEVPVEKIDEAIEILGGWPHPGTDTWCAIAKLNPGAEPDHSRAVSADSQTAPTMKGERSDSCSPKPHQADNPSPSGGGRRSWQDMSPAQQAGVLCNDPVFQRFLDEIPPRRRSIFYLNDNENRDNPADRAAAEVRSICGVTSRKLIVAGTESAHHWQKLVSDFRAWQREPEIVP